VTDLPVPFGAYQYQIYLQGLGGVKPIIPTTYEGLEAQARETLSPEAFWYAAGGAGEGHTMDANRAAFDRWQIVPRMLGDISTRDLSTEVLGTRLNAPVMMGPVGVLSIMHPDAELAVARAAAETGIGMCLSTAASNAMEPVAEAAGDAPRWYQLYWPSDDELAMSLVRRAEAAGYEAIVITLDTRVMPWRPFDIAGAYLPFLLGEGIANYTSDPVFQARVAANGTEDQKMANIQEWIAMFPNPTLDWDKLTTLREHTSLPIVVKGVLHPEDAKRVVNLGLDGIIVSNHGGRQIDGSVSSLGQLPAIVSAVPDDFPVLLDSGVRTGSDVIKAVSLGARAVFVARPWVWGLGLAGQAGVVQVMRSLLADLDQTMAMCSATSIADLNEGLLTAAP
jgi:isopentenyl diphosphate isomerase/L-lactate dehydrogenase-like FMN-dependent dehydrogenase